MKLDPAQVRFVAPTPAFRRRRLLFVGKSNTLQLLETALVIEGYLKKLSFPLADAFFQRVLSEWTTVTVPYSRIERFDYHRLLIRRVLLTLLFCSPALLMLMVLVGSRPDTTTLPAALMLGLLGLVLSAYVDLRLRARHWLLFRRADGGLTAVAFRIKTRRWRESFAALLDNNRRQAAGLAPVVPAASPPARRLAAALPLLILAAYIAGTYLIAPLWHTFVRPTLAPAPRVLAPQSPFPRPGGAVPGRRGMAPRIVAPPRAVPDATEPDALLEIGRFLFRAGLILALTFLMWRRSRAIRWTAVVLLLLQAITGIFGPAAWRTLGVLGAGDGPNYVDIGLESGVSLAFYLTLAALVALSRVMAAPKGKLAPASS